MVLSVWIRLILGLGLGLLVLVGLRGASSGPSLSWQWPLASATPTPTTAQRALLAELQRRLQRPWPPPYGYGVPPFSSTGLLDLLPGTPPRAWPVSLPLLPGGRLLGSAVYDAAHERQQVVVLDAPANDPYTVLDFYEQALATQNWHSSSANTPIPPGGFQPEHYRVLSWVFCPLPAKSALVFLLLPNPGGVHEVRFALNQQRLGLCAGYTPDAPTPPKPPRPLLLIPHFVWPDGVNVVSATFATGLPETGYPKTGSRSEALIESELGAGDLAEVFGRQLAAAGWTEVASTTSAIEAQSRWRLPGPGSPQGTLRVQIGPGAQQRTLEVRVADDAAAGPQ